MLKLQKYHQLTALVYSQNAAQSNLALDWFGVKWIVTGAPWQNILWAGAPRELRMIERPAPLPRFKLFGALAPVADDAEAWQHIISGRATAATPLVEPICLLNGAATTRPLTMPATPAGTAGGDRLQIARETANQITVQTESAGARLLWFGDTWYPGWRATIDGAEAPVHRANYMFMAVPVPPGRHTVRLEFWPRNLGWHLAGATLGLLAIGALLVIPAARKPEK
jgi:hypothetical protein